MEENLSERKKSSCTQTDANKVNGDNKLPQKLNEKIVFRFITKFVFIALTFLSLSLVFIPVFSYKTCSQAKILRDNIFL